MTVLRLASERCVATDEICVKGVRGCFPDKRLISSCFGRGLSIFARVGTAVHCLPSMLSKDLQEFGQNGSFHAFSRYGGSSSLVIQIPRSEQATAVCVTKCDMSQ